MTSSRSKSAKVSPKNIKHPSSPVTIFFRNALLWQALAIIAVAFLLYGQTLNNGYMIDDRMAITENAVVKKGVSGLGDILTKDSFYGFDSELMRTGQRKTYRPLSFVMFALEWQIFPNKPFAARMIHLSLYAALAVVLLFLLRNLFSAQQSNKQQGSKQYTFLQEWLPFLSAILFVVHPIHTEVVCNIKSRDEILALLFMLGALLFFVRSIDKHSLPLQLAAALCCALGLLSKESAVGFMPVFPLALYFFRPALGVRQILVASAPILGVAITYLVLWFGIIGRVEEALYILPLTNPFVGTGFAERSATAFWIVALYIGKAIYPVTLSHSYTFNAIPIMTWTDWKPLFALILCLALIVFAAWKTRERDVVAFCIWFFFCTIALASNLFVYVGGLLGERFLFMPSVAAVLALAFLAVRFLQRWKLYVFIAIAALAAAYSVRTFDRSIEWSSEAALFKADALSTPQSYQAQTAFAKELLKQSFETPNGFTKQQMLAEALEHLEAARKIDSTSDPQLYTIFGLCYAETGDMMNALRYEKIGFERVQSALLYKSTPGYTCYAAKCYGQTILSAVQRGQFVDSTQAMRQLQDAAWALRTAIQRDTPTVDADVPMALANCYDALSAYDSAMTFSETALAVKTSQKRHLDNYVIVASNYGGSLMQQGRFNEAAAVFSRGVKWYGANSARLHWGLGMAHLAAGQYDTAIPSLRRAVELDPLSQRLKDDLARAEAKAKAP